LWAKGIWVNGNQHGVWVEYHINGQLKSRSYYLNGVLQGKSVVYDTAGNLEEENYYRDGIIVTDKKEQKNLLRQYPASR
jgi:antitoxin component YwqK of YwqJK toxin-antitoxin module